MKRILFFRKWFSLLNLLSPLVDIFIAIGFVNSKNTVWQVIGYALLIFVIYRFIRAFFKVLRSRSELDYYLSNNRVLAIDGKQRSGKSSFVCYAASVLKVPTFSNIPFKIKGRYTNKLSTDILSCREAVPEYSLLCIDECNLFYHNLRTSSGKTNDTIFGQSVLEQCVGHFTDGNIIYSATVVDRLPKEIRDNFSARLQMLGQRSYQFSFMGACFLRLLGKLCGIKKVYTGLRVWDAQHFEKLKEEGYVYDLSSNTTKDGVRFANLMEFACFQSVKSFEYDDRYMKTFYDQLPLAEIIEWDDLRLSFDDFDYLYDSEIIEYFNRILAQNKAP